MKFLESRIKDTESSLATRQIINRKALEEITADIDEKLSKLSTVTDTDMVRDLQLDLTNLKMERRREVLLSWKDRIELQRELQQLREQLVVESKIAQLFEERELPPRHPGSHTWYISFEGTLLEVFLAYGYAP